eukprot:453125_1
MTALDHNTSSPPPSTSNNKDKDKNNNNAQRQLSGFTVTTNNFGGNNAVNAPFLTTRMSPNTSNNTAIWSFAYQSNNGFNPHQSPQLMSYIPLAPPPPASALPNSNNNSVKRELNMSLPSSMGRISSVARQPSQNGYCAYDKDNRLVGYFDDNATFLDVDQFNNEAPIFDQSQMLIRNQSD